MLALPALPEPEPVVAEAPPAAKPAPAAAPRVAKPATPKPRAARRAAAPANTAPSAEPANAVPSVEPGVKSGPAPAVAAAAPAVPAAEPAAKLTPLETALECVGRGDNECVIATLEGKTKSARELELLIETYRATGQSEAASRNMRGYIERFPGERRAITYGKQLE
jgi:hypothetical protein